MKSPWKLIIPSIFFIITAIHLSVDAQDYNYKTGIGVRLGGYSTGLSVKEFVSPTSAIEGIVSFGYSSLFLTALYEKQRNIYSAPGLSWFYGGGLHIGFFDNGPYMYTYDPYFGDYVYDGRYSHSATAGGVDFILGLEYKFANEPFSVGVDVKPFIDFYNNYEGYFDAALTLRFAF